MKSHCVQPLASLLPVGMVRSSFLLMLCGVISIVQPTSAGSLPSLKGPVALSNGLSEVQVVGQAGTNYILQGTTDFTHWLDLSAVKATNSTMSLVDPFGLMGPATEFSPDRFYRVRLAMDNEVPNPIHATLQVDTDATVTAEVNLSGGSLALTNADGTIYQLQFSTNNPLDLEEITMTLITNVSGLPVTRPLLAGVSIAPEDLPLIGVPTLIITNPAGFPSSSVLGFSSQGSGDEFHPYPTRIAGNQLLFHIHQFGGFGALQANAADAGAFQQRQPTSLEGQIEQKLALILLTNGVTNLSVQPRGTSTAQDQAYAAESQFLNLVVDTELIIAETDEGMFGVAMQSYVDWYARVQDEGLVNRFSAQIAQANQYVVAAFENSINHKSQRCDQHDLDQILRMVNAGRIMGWQPWAPAFTPAIRQDLEDKIRRCATFQVDFDSLMINTSDAGVERSRTHGDITVQFGSPISHLSGQGTLAFTETTITYPVSPPCSPITAAPVSATFDIPYCALHMIIALDNWSPTNRWRFKDATIDFPLPMVHEGYYIVCAGVRSDLADFWYPEFGDAHLAELTSFTPPGGPPEAVFRITGWKPAPPGGALIATKSYQRTVQYKTATVEEQTTLTLIHTPMP